MASLEVPVQIDLEALASRVTEQIRGSRESVMALTYGEAVTKASAAKMLNVTGRTICQMIRDGRLLDACRGDIQAGAEELDQKIQAAARPHQDNYTAVICKYNE